ncbi:MAG: motility protein A [Firmicutes bacterium]|nr:motility protein A [Bacillota bacterium]
MDIATITGIVVGIGLIVGAILSSGSLTTFWDVPSMMITIGGTLAGTFINYPMSQIISVIKVLRNAFRKDLMRPASVINLLVSFADKARREGLLALEEEAENTDDDFFKKGIQLVVDGSDPELVRNILETELAFLEERHRSGQGIFTTMGSLAPAFGMVGTLIGLINMLRELETPENIGPSMALALITTFYGVLFANLICIPVAGKLAIRSEQEVLIKELIIEGVLSIQAGENPRIVEEKLKAFLAPDDRAMLQTERDMRKVGEHDGEIF